MNVLRSLGGQSVTLALGTGVAQVLLAVMFILAARSMSPADLGEVATALAIGTLLAGLLDFGTNSYWVRQLTSRRMSMSDLAPFRTGKLMSVVVVTTTFGVGAWAFVPSDAWVAAPVAALLALAQSNQAILRAEARSHLVALSLLIDRVVALATFLVLQSALELPVGDSLWLAVCFGTLGGSLASRLLSTRGSRPAFDIRVPRWPYTHSRHYGVASLASSAQSLDLLLISTLAGSAAAGVFSAVNRWTAPLGLLVTAFAQAAVPFVAAAVSWREVWPVIRRVLWMPLSAIGGCVAIAFSAPLIVPILLGEDYAPSSTILQVLAIAVIPAIVSQPALAFLQARGHDRATGRILAIIVALQLVAICIGAYWFSALGAAVAILLGQAAMALNLLLYAARTGTTS